MKTRLFAGEIDVARSGFVQDRSQARLKWFEKFLLVSGFFVAPGFFVIGIFVASALMCPGEEESVRLNAEGIILGCEDFFVEQGRYPVELRELADPPRGRVIMERVPQDPWGHEYRYRLRGGVHQDITVVSQGPDGILHSDDDIAYGAPLRNIH